MEHQEFVNNFGFGTWVHYIVTYNNDTKKDGYHGEVYFNGEVHPDAFKWNGPFSPMNGYDGRLELGSFQLGEDWWGIANMSMDDLIIWEEEIPCDDALRLYQAYNA